MDLLKKWGDSMIFVTLGTQDKPFNRLLKAIENAIESGIIKEKVIVQAGYTKFTSDKMEIIDLLPMDEFNNLIKKCDLLITHAGVGSIIAGLKEKKKVISVARLSKFKEHVNDHQLQINNNLEQLGYIIAINDEQIDLKKALEKSKKFHPKTYHSNTQNMIELVKKCIEN